MGKLFNLVASCIYASGVSFVGFTLVHFNDMSEKKRVEYIAVGILMIMLMAAIQLAFRCRQRKNY